MAGETNKVVLVTGGSSGIGRCTASALKENGCTVYEFCRRDIPMEGVTHLSVDVTDEDKLKKSAEEPSKIGKFLGGIRFAGLCFLGEVLFLRKKSFHDQSVFPLGAGTGRSCKDDTTFPAKAVLVCPVRSIQNFSINGDGDHLPRNKLSAGL